MEPHRRPRQGTEMPSKTTNHSKRTTKKSAKKALASPRRRTTLRRIHTAPAATAADIRASLGISKADFEAALTAIESAL